MQPFPPSIVHALLHEPRRHDLNDEVRAIRERSGRSRIRPRTRNRLRTGRSTVRLGDESPRAA